MTTVGNVAACIKRAAPESLAEDWDNSGLQLGSYQAPVNSVLTVLDITPDTVAEAKELGANLIVSHHPLFFKNIKSIRTDTAKGALIEDLLKNDMSVYSAHTNLDKASNGLNTFIGRLLALQNTSPLIPEKEDYVKLVVYTPKGYEQQVIEAMDESGAGTTGQGYTSCTFRTEGTGTFRANTQAHPFIGEAGELTQTQEYKIETIVPKSALERVFKSVRRVHPYEEMAYDIYPTELIDLPATTGLGRIGMADQVRSPEEFAAFVKETLGLERLVSAGPKPESVKKVALCTGAGAEFISAAKRAGADVYITGDLKHHDAQAAEQAGLWVLDAGHYGTEKQASILLAELLADCGVPVYVSKTQKNFMESY